MYVCVISYTSALGGVGAIVLLLSNISYHLHECGPVATVDVCILFC